MAWIWAIFGLLALFYVLQPLIWKSKKRLPPGPRGFPIFGSLHLLGKFPNKDLHQLAQKYGDIMYMSLGLLPVIVVSSPRAAELFLKTHDLVFASRPSHEGSKHLSYGPKQISFAKYGPYWRNMRKMCTIELLSSHKINSFKSMRKEELAILVDSIAESSGKKKHVAVDLSSKVSSLSANMTCMMVFGKKYMDEEFDERGFKSVLHEVMKLGAAPNLGDYIPCIAPLDLQGLTKRMKALHKVFDNFLEKIIVEHLQSRDHGESKTKDFVDVMLELMGSEESEYQIERSNIKAILMEMLVATMDTSATTIEWALSELIKHPEVMSKLQRELANVVGMDRMVEESDLVKMEYLYMVVKETMRLHPIAPLLVPRESMEDCTVNGFYIPKKCRIMINVWAIGRDPNAWTEAEKFIPERFVGSSIDLRGNHFELIPFGSGRRSCAGMQLGLTVVQFVVAQLVHCFDWELPDNMSPVELDMTEEFGMTVSRAKHLLAIPSYRLEK